MINEKVSKNTAVGNLKKRACDNTGIFEQILPRYFQFDLKGVALAAL